MRARAILLLLFCACSSDVELYYADNPVTAIAVCSATAPCPAGKVCHLAIGGGTCAAPCTGTPAAADAYCQSLSPSASPALICQSDAGGVCGPRCDQPVNGYSGDQICSALDVTLSCQLQDANDYNVCTSANTSTCVGRCAPAVAAAYAYVRVFNAVPSEAVVVLTINGQSTTNIPGVPAGSLVPGGYAQVPVGTATVGVNDGTSGDVLTTAVFGFAAGVHYTLLFSVDVLGADHLIAVTDDITQPTQAGNFWVQYTNLNGGDVTRDLRYAVANGTTPPPFSQFQLVYGTVLFDELRAPVQLPAPTASQQAVFGVSQPPGSYNLDQGTAVVTSTPTCPSGVPLGGSCQPSYLVVTWPGLFGQDETQVFGSQGVVSSSSGGGPAIFQSASIRVANATEDISVLTVGLDDVDTGTTSGINALVAALGINQLTPPGGYEELPVGNHSFSVSDPNGMYVTTNQLSPGNTSSVVLGHQYTLFVGGTVVGNNPAATVYYELLDDAAPAAGTNQAIRLANFAMDANAPATLLTGPADSTLAETTPLISNVPYQAVSAYDVTAIAGALQIQDGAIVVPPTPAQPQPADGTINVLPTPVVVAGAAYTAALTSTPGPAYHFWLLGPTGTVQLDPGPVNMPDPNGN